MKNKFTKKYNNLFVLGIVTLVSFFAPSFLYISAKKAGIGSSGGGIYSGEIDFSYTGKYVTDNGTHNYVEPNFNSSGVKYEIKSGGDSKKYHLYETQADVDAAKARGACDINPCATGAEFGFTGSRETWGMQLANAGNSAAGNGESFDLSNPVAYEYVKQALSMQGYDISNMSQKEIEELATEYAQENNGLVATDLMHTTLIKNTITGEYLYCPGNAECDKAYAEGFVIDAIFDFKYYGETHAWTNDEGNLCSEDECPPAGGGCEDCEPEDVVDFELNKDTCSISIPEIPKPNPKAIPDDYFSGGECGSTATKKTYTSYTAGCGLVVMLKTETVTAHLPSSPSVVYAGKTFNWGGVTSNKNISTTIWDTSELTYEMTKVNSQIESINSVIGCLNDAMQKLQQEYANKANECSKAVASAAGACISCNQNCANNKIENCDCTITCDAVKAQGEVCDALKTQYDEYIKEYELQIEGYKEDLSLLSEQLEYYKSCANSIPNSSASTTTGTVQLINQKMELSTGYVQTINSIKGVAKNSGMPLTAAEIEKIEDDTYFEIVGEFFMPYYVKNGTSGKLVGDITGDISISSYNCPINVTNYILCEDDDCGSTPTNLDIIYRPISLTNPFPNVNGESSNRPMGTNWNENYERIFITNNRGVENYNIYKLKPIYTITLTPSVIKDIRNYNKQNSLNNFDMNCTDGYSCISKFLWEKFDGIVDTSNSCASSTGWDASCYDGGVSE